VGETVELLVGPINAADNTPVFLTILGSYGPNLLRAQFEGGMAWFQIPAEMTTRSGTVSLVATAGNARGQATLQLLPDEPVEPITPLVGARSIIADGDHWAMAVVVPFDRFGNPVAEGTAVQMRSLHPGNNLNAHDTTIEHLLAWERIFSGTKAGRTVIAANIADVHGPEGILMEIPGWPVPFKLAADPPTLPADGFQLMTLRSDVITDRFDNIMPDGTQVSFVVTGPAEDVRFIPAQTVDGVAETVMQAPELPGDYDIRVAVFGVESEPLVVEFTPGPAIGRFAVDVEVNNENGELLLVAGPITAVLDQYVPDGTPVQYTVTGPDKEEQLVTAVTDAGYATAALRLFQLASGTYNVEVAAGSGVGTSRFTMP
jgi:hypothetical protein